MKKVNIYKLNNDGTQSVVVICELSGRKVICKGEEILTRNLEKNGIKDYASRDGKVLYFSDGLNFLKQLKFNFKSGYLNASDIVKE